MPDSPEFIQHTNRHTNTHTNMHMNTHTNMHTNTHTNTPMNTHTRIRTQTDTDKRLGHSHGHAAWKWACTMDTDKQHGCRNADEKFSLASLVFR
jgi:hypothetical protein